MVGAESHGPALDVCSHSLAGFGDPALHQKRVGTDRWAVRWCYGAPSGHALPTTGLLRKNALQFDSVACEDRAALESGVVTELLLDT